MTTYAPYALVTGASSGIGYQYARIMAEKGYNVIMVSNEADAIVEKAETIRKDYPVETVPLMRDLGRGSGQRVVRLLR